MSFSLYTRSIEHYQKHFGDQIKEQGNKLWMKNHFLPQTKFDALNAAHILSMKRIMCIEECSVVDYINNVIAGNIEKECKKNLCENIEQYKCFKQIDCSDSEVVQSCTSIGITQF